MKVLESAGLHLVEISGQRFIMSDEHLAKLKANVQKKINAQNRRIKTTAKPKQHAKQVTGLDKDYKTAPDPPKMKWHKNGSPDFSHLQHTPNHTRVNRHIPKEQMRVPVPPKMIWNRDGSSDWYHL